MTQNTHRLLRLLFVALLAAFLGCGGGNKSTVKKPRSRARKAKVAVAPKPEPKKIVNPQWTLVRPYFSKFLDASIGGFKDPFEPQLLRYIGRQQLLDRVRLAIKQPAQTGIPEQEPGLRVPKGPLQRYSVDSYRPIIIQTGTAEPKAVIVSPDANTYVITKDTYVGSEGGYVEDITQYYVVFKVPGRDEPVMKSLKPALLDWQAKGSEHLLQIQPRR